MTRFSFESSNSNNTMTDHAFQFSENRWSCKECTFENDCNVIQCKICQTHHCKKRVIHKLDDISQPPSKKRKINGTKTVQQNEMELMDIDENINSINGNNNSNHNMQQLYFPSNHNKEEKQADPTLDSMNEFGAEKPKVDRIKKEEEYSYEWYNNYKIKEEEINDSNFMFDIDFSSHLTDDMYLYYSGEDMDALDWTGSEYKQDNLWELEKQFFEWKNIYQGCVLMIQNGYKYECYEHDAFIVSIVLGVHSSRKVGTLLKVLLPEFKLDSYLRRLVEVGLMVAVISQTQTSTTMDRKTQKTLHRELTGVYSKGTLFSPHITSLNMDNCISQTYLDNENPESRYILSFHEIPLDAAFDMANNIEFNIILCDLYSGYLYYDQFEDTFLRPKFLTILNHFNIVEILLPRKEISNNTRCILNNRYSKLGNRKSVRWVQYQLSQFEYSHCNTLLIDTYSGEKNGEWIAFILQEWHQSIIISFCMLVDYLQKCGLHLTLMHCSKMEALSNKMYMNLSGITTQHLDIFCNREGGTKCTLFELLSRNNQTFYGRRLMHEWVTRPLYDIKQIKLRQNAVKYIMELRENGASDWLLALVTKLANGKDLERRLRIIQCKKCPPKLFLGALKEFNEILAMLPNGDVINEMRKESGSLLLFELFQSINENKSELLDVINKFILLLNEDMTGYQDAIKDVTKYPKLFECEKEIKTAEETLFKLLKELKIMFNDPDLEYKSMKSGDYLIEIGKNKLINGNLKIPSKWKLNSETKTHLRYQPIEVEIAAISLAIQEEKQLFFAKRAWFHFLDDFNQCGSSILCQFVSVLSQFDCLYSFGVLASNLNYCLPQFIEEKDNQQYLEIINGRHPTLEEYLSPFISNNIKLGSPSGPNTMIITGPNMGGKSVYIKMIASLIIMSQIGSYIPCDNMIITPFDMIGTRIGIYDDILNGKSTFFVEMTETSYLIKNATHKSFLILDELGRGTSTFDGTAMAYSTIKYIVDHIKCFCLFVTHYTNLLQLKNEYNTSGNVLDNYFMTFEINNKINFLYKINHGECKQSYGIQVAQAAGVNNNIINRAKQCSNDMKQYVTDNDKIIHEFQSLLSKLHIV